MTETDVRTWLESPEGEDWSRSVHIPANWRHDGTIAQLKLDNERGERWDDSTFTVLPTAYRNTGERIE